MTFLIIQRLISNGQSISLDRQAVEGMNYFNYYWWKYMLLQQVKPLNNETSRRSVINKKVFLVAAALVVAAGIAHAQGKTAGSVLNRQTRIKAAPCFQHRTPSFTSPCPCRPGINPAHEINRRNAGIEEKTRSAIRIDA